MIYTTYYAQTNSITEERYKELKEAYLSTNTGNLESFHLRKLEFQGAGQRKAVASYYLCMKNRDESQIFLEKKYMQNGLYFKKCAKLSREESEKLLNGDLEWMKNHRKELLADFYRQATLNSLYPGRITEYRREMCRVKKGDYVTLTTAIGRGIGPCRSLFEEPEMKLPCLDKGKVLLTYKKSASLPQMVSSMLQGQSMEEKQDEYGFIF